MLLSFFDIFFLKLVAYSLYIGRVTDLLPVHLNTWSSSDSSFLSSSHCSSFCPIC